MNYTRFQSILTVIIVLFSGIFPSLQAQSTSWYPDLPFQTTSLIWNVEMDAALDGFKATAEYTVRANRDDVQIITFSQRDLFIESVRVNDEEIPFIAAGESVRISLPEALDRGSEFSMSIKYEAYPAFGYYIDPQQVVWSSNLPGALYSILPIIDHPRIRLRTEISILHDSGVHAVASGLFISRTSLSENTVKTLFRSRTPLPVSGIRIAAGNWNPVESKIGTLPVRLYAPSALITTAERELITALIRAEMTRLATQLKTPFPFEALSVLLVPSSYGEMWGDAAGLGYLFDDIGDLQTQVKLLVASQWLRHGLSPMTDDEHFALNSYTRAVAQLEESALASDVSRLASLNGSIDARSLLAHEFEGTGLADYPAKDVEMMMKHVPGIIMRTQIDDARYMRNWSNHPIETSPGLMPYREPISDMAKEVGFYLRFSRTENPNQLSLTIDPYGNPQPGEYIFTLEEVYIDTILTQVIRFQEGGGDAVIEVETGVLNVKIGPDIAFSYQIEKPLGYWLHQLRSTGNTNSRIEAALSMSVFANDPDLGLVIRDLERNETDPAVKAALATSLAEGGQIEINETFLRSLLSNNDASIRQKAYSMIAANGQDSVSAAILMDYLEGDIEHDERERVVQLLSRVMEPEAYTTYIQDELMADSDNKYAGIVLQSLFSEGSIDAAIVMADSLLHRSYPYSIRSMAIRLLNQYDDDTARWSQRLPALASDQDPRIRVNALELSVRLNADQSRILYEDRLAKEVDLRVKTRLSQIMR